ncbi:MAG: hypothetical protein OJF52_000960 [Nitrospira sp.]|nr:MAG: hypothetical protein OJF52_000960 [Nitrospira sp.]
MPSIVVRKALSCYWTLQVLGLGLINVLSTRSVEIGWCDGSSRTFPTAESGASVARPRERI